MILNFKENVGGVPTYFPRKILGGLPASENLRTGRHFSDFQTDYYKGINDYRDRPKIHTLRDDNDRWEVGDMINFSVGARSPRYREFAVGTCLGKQRVSMNIRDSGKLLVAVHPDHESSFATQHDGKRYSNQLARVFSDEELAVFAINDGFDTVEAFDAWFRPLVKREGNLKSFALIHWTTLTYSAHENKPTPQLSAEFIRISHLITDTQTAD